MTRRSPWLALGGLTAVAVLLLFSQHSVLATSGNLPGGTAIEVTIDDPVTSTEFLAAGPGGTVDVSVSGTASVAAGVPLKNTTVVYVMDVSGSMNADAQVDCDGVAGDDTRLVCEKEGVAAANTAADDPFSAIGLTGLASFSSGGAAHDVDLGAGGTQLLVSPSLDGNTNSTPDLEDVAFGLSASGQTDYADGLSAAFTILNDASNTSAVNIVLFLSDADNQSVFVGSNVSTLVGSVPANTTINAFGLGVGPSCTFDGTTGSLNDIAALSTLGTGVCQIIANPALLANEILQSLGSTLESLEIEVDGGGATPIDNADIDPDLPANGGFDPKNANYSTTVAALGVGDHTICVRATGTDAGGTDSVTECETIHILAISLAPDGVVNELGTPGQTHTVTASVAGPAAGPASVAGRTVNFSVIAGPNAGAAGAAVTDAGGQASFTYTATQGLAGLGTDTIRSCITLNTPLGETGCDEVTKDWVDTTPPEPACTETVNPHGNKVPPAGSTTLPGPKGGQNEDGFYELSAWDAVDPNPAIYVADSGSGAVFGPFASGDKIKYTEDSTAMPTAKMMGSDKGKAGAIDAHIIGNGDPLVFAVDASGNQSDPLACLVPPVPK